VKLHITVDIRGEGIEEGIEEDLVLAVGNGIDKATAFDSLRIEARTDSTPLTDPADIIIGADDNQRPRAWQRINPLDS